MMMRKIGWLGVVIFIMSCHSEKASISHDIITETSGTELEFLDEIPDNAVSEIGNRESEYVNELSRRVKARQIFNYVVAKNYQKDFVFMYELYTKHGLFPLDEAFEIKSQPENEFVYKDIRLVESYTYYGIPIEINEIPNGCQGNYYLAIVDLCLRYSFELLLFDEESKYLDSYKFETRYMPKRELYAYQEIYEKTYGILTTLNGSHGIYLTLVVIDKGRFKEVFSANLDPAIYSYD
jgi:hypothetical protein